MKITELQKMGFQKSGSIIKIEPTAHEVKVGFELEPGLSTEPHVYVWVDVTDTNEIVVLYCGRAGKGIKARMGQHKQGFKGDGNSGSASGKKKHEKLLKLLNDKSKIEIWSKLVLDPEKQEEDIIKKISKFRNNWLVLNSIV